MNRKETFIIAVLVNTGLLMVLFATALKSDQKKEPKALAKSTQAVEVKKVPEKSTFVATNDIATMPSIHRPAEESTKVQSIHPITSSPIEPLDKLSLTPTLSYVHPPEPVVAPISSPQTEKKPILAPATEKGFVCVTVKKGDFLEKIAKAHNTTVAVIMQENQLSSSQLKVGQVLKVPGKELASIAKAEPVPPVAPLIAEEFYTVKEGDNPWLIASKNHVRLEELLKINGLNDQTARKLKPGDRLKIR